ncbi:MAG: hypothetical protein WC737_00280 [Parcubacteria group bacterium]|jgi:hypothetical protein
MRRIPRTEILLDSRLFYHHFSEIEILIAIKKPPQCFHCGVEINPESRIHFPLRGKILSIPKRDGKSEPEIL